MRELFVCGQRAALILGLAWGCTSQRAPIGSESAVPSPHELCADVPAGYYTDSAELAATRGRVVRDGCRLRFRTSRGDSLVLADNLAEGDPHLRHLYLGQVPALGLHLVQVRLYEGGGYLLVAPDGGRTYIAGVPVVAPDAQRFVTTSIDLEAEYDPNVIELWRLEHGRPLLELALQSGEWAPTDATWLDSVTVVFTQNFPSDSVGVYRTQTARVSRRAGGWAFEPQAP